MAKAEKFYSDSETGCCKKFDPAPWNEKEITFSNKLFLKAHVICFFHIPLNMGQVIVKSMEKIAGAGALAHEPLMLSDESLFGSDLYIAVSREVPGAQIERISGTFLSKVFEGPYQDAGKWAEQMQAFAKSKGKEAKKTYFFYTTCPKCAQAYGKNYTVLLAKI